jgi:hypothetical protein
MIVVVFYCYMINDWEEKLQRQIKRLIKSGLYESASEIYLYVTDASNQQKSKVESLLVDCPKIKLDYTTRNYGEAVLALSKVDELGKSGDYKILYFHTKGVFNKYKNFQTKEINELKLKGVNCWVEMMEYYLIDNWKACVEKLDNYHTVGVGNYGGWWWGNFWWARSDHIKNNENFRDFHGGSRWRAEAWLHEANSKRNEIKYYEFNHYSYDNYYSVIPEYMYKSDTDFNVEITKAELGYFGEQRDEGRPAPKNASVVDVTEEAKSCLVKESNKWVIKTRQVERLIKEDPAFGFQKILRVNFRTNIDPENEYTITSFESWDIVFK